MPSFSAKAKAEALRAASKSEAARRAELAAFVRFLGAVGIARGELTLTLSTSLKKAAERIWALLRKLYGFEAEMARVEGGKLSRVPRYRVTLRGEGARRVLADCGILSNDSDGGLFGANAYCPHTRAQTDAYLRAAFVACGTMTPPSRGYHLEFVAQNAADAEALKDLLVRELINAHVFERAGRAVVYVKEAGCVAALLGRIGAHAAVLDFENERLMREIRNDVNRGVNCSTANIKKTAEASMRQIRAIQILEREGVLRDQPQSIRRTAELRIDNPESSLDELAQMMPGVTRSGVNHRIRRILQLAALYGDPDA